MSNQTPQPPYVYQAYPKIVYHLDGTNKRIESLEEQQALGPEWFESRADAVAASPAIWFPADLRQPIVDALSEAGLKLQESKDLILKGGPVTKLDRNSLIVSFVVYVLPFIARQAREMFRKGLWTRHRVLDELEKRLLHLVQHAARKMAVALNDNETHAWVLDEVKKTPEYATFRVSATNDDVAPSQWDLFICHASEDKENFVRPLAVALLGKNLKVWYDEITLTLGDSLQKSIDRGLKDSRFGVVVLSHDFFAKDWPQRELDGLVALERNGRKVILPIWHNLTRDDVCRYSPTLAGRIAALSSDGIATVVTKILDAIQ